MTFILNKSDYDPSLDYLKGLCIFFVVLTHCIPIQVHDWSLFCLWGDMAVPLFLIIQVFHAYKRGKVAPRFQISKIWFRILRPFLMVQSVILLIMLCGGGDLLTTVVTFVVGGGNGPGSYYTWIYLQFALLLPVLHKYIVNMSKTRLLIVFVGLSIIIELLCSLIQMPQFLYRLLCLRYVFLIYFGVQVVRDGIVMNRSLLVLSFFSTLTVLFFSYADFNMEPVFFQTGWKICHWPCYFYVGYLLLWLLRWSYNWMQLRFPRVELVVEQMGRYSYEIFLWQMFWFFLIIIGRERIIDIVSEHILYASLIIDIVVMCISPFVCVIPVLGLKKVRFLSV